MKQLDSLWVCRGPGGYLGRTGKHLHLTADAELIQASVYVTRDDAWGDAKRSAQILGVGFTIESHPVANLLPPKKEKPGGPARLITAPRKSASPILDGVTS